MSDKHIRTGGDGADTIYGDDGLDLIKGEGGNDVLVGHGGDDSLYGGVGNDYLIGGTGNDVLFGGDGIDWADYAAAGAAVTVNLNITTAQDTRGDGVDTLNSIERVYGSAFDDKITGDKFDNLLHGSDGADTLAGGGGRDALIGDAGDDLLIGGHGADYFEGGFDNDTYVLNDKFDQVVELAGEGEDTVRTNRSHHLEANVENLILSGAKDLKAWGNSLANEITGNIGENRIEFGGGDTVSGGGGQDTYVLEATFRGAAVVDGADNTGKVDFTRIDADTTTPGHQAFHEAPNNQFTGVAGEIIAVVSDDYDAPVYIAFDTNGDGKADGELTVQHWHNLDFAI
jgi:Ca2+-binding RTX toxin-like protein